MKWYSNESQIAWACDALISGREISHNDEISEAKGWRLSAIICNLRHRYKWPINTRYDENRIAYYALGKFDAAKLKKPRSFRKWEAAATASHSKPESCKNQPEDK